MAVFGWIGHLVLLFKIQGGINFACLFSGGLKECCKKIRGAFFRYPEKSNPPANLPPLTKNVTWDTWCSTILFNGDGNFENHCKFVMVVKKCAKSPTNTTTNLKFRK